MPLRPSIKETHREKGRQYPTMSRVSIEKHPKKLMRLFSGGLPAVPKEFSKRK
jgi:hypothetical protein